MKFGAAAAVAAPLLRPNQAGAYDTGCFLFPLCLPLSRIAHCVLFCAQHSARTHTHTHRNESERGGGRERQYAMNIFFDYLSPLSAGQGEGRQALTLQQRSQFRNEVCMILCVCAF